MKSNTYYFLLLFVISFLFRLILIMVFQFDGLYGQDAYTYYDNSKIFLESILSFHIPPNFYWPIGYPLFTSIFSLFTAGNIGYAAMLVSLNAGSLCAGVGYLIAYELLVYRRNEQERKNISLYAGLILCFSGVLVKASIVIMSDALGLLFASLCMLFLMKYYHSRKLPSMILGFVSLALAIMTRYAYIILLIPVAIIMIYFLYNRIGTAKHVIFGVLAGFLVFLPQLYYIAKYGIAYLPSQPEEKIWVVEWSPVNFFLRDFSTKDGTMHYKIWNGLYYLSPAFHPLYLSAFGLTFIYGIVTVLRKKQFQIFFFCILWIIFFYIYLAGSPYQSLRYTMSFLPALAIVSAVGLNSIKIGNTGRNVFLFAGIVALIGYGLYQLKTFAEQKQDELTVVKWVDDNIPAGSEIYSFEITPALAHYSQFKPREFYLVQHEELTQIPESAYFVLPEEKLHNQWKGLPIENNFNFLKATYPMRQVGDVGYYKIYVILK